MNGTSDKTEGYNLPTASTSPETLDRLRRGLCQQAAGLKEQLSGVQQQIRAIDSLKKQTGQQAET